MEMLYLAWAILATIISFVLLVCAIYSLNSYQEGIKENLKLEKLLQVASDYISTEQKMLDDFLGYVSGREEVSKKKEIYKRYNMRPIHFDSSDG